MAIFESTARRKPGTRSNTKLRVSGGLSPAGQWVTDQNLPILFHYDYGGPGQKEVVVSKGMVVGVQPNYRGYDDHLGYHKNALTIATDVIRPFGMAPFNYTKHHQDFLDGNQPAVITRDYVELPWIAKADDAAAIKWGAIYGDLKPNDLVTWSRSSDNFGKLIKWEEGTHSTADIIGQVGEIETDQEPFGWLKWAMWDETARYQDQDGPQSKGEFVPPDVDGFPYDPEYARLGKNGENGYFSQNYTTINDATGVPGILDGREKAQTVQSRQFAIAAGTTAGTNVQFALGLRNIVEGTVKVFVGGSSVPVDSSALAIDYTNGLVTYTNESDRTGATNVEVQFRANFFGTPAGWDHKGAVGAARILLKF